MKEQKICPLCGKKLYERYEGLVCKNNLCKLYHKVGHGWVLIHNESNWSRNRSRINIFFSSNTRLRLQEQWANKKKEILIRDDYTCQKCKFCLADDWYRIYPLHIHHIIPASEEMALYFDNDNLITLCEKCHKEVHEFDKHKYLV